MWSVFAFVSSKWHGTGFSASLCHGRLVTLTCLYCVFLVVNGVLRLQNSSLMQKATLHLVLLIRPNLLLCVVSVCYMSCGSEVGASQGQELKPSSRRSSFGASLRSKRSCPTFVVSPRSSLCTLSQDRRMKCLAEAMTMWDVASSKLTDVDYIVPYTPGVQTRPLFDEGIDRASSFAE